MCAKGQKINSSIRVAVINLIESEYKDLLSKKWTREVTGSRNVPRGVLLNKKLNFADNPDQVSLAHLWRGAKTISKKSSCLHMVKSGFLKNSKQCEPQRN